MFDSRLFAVTRRLHDGREVFRREAAALRADEFVDWPERDAYSTGWQVFPLVLRARPGSMAVDLAYNRRRCPESAALLDAAGVLIGGVSRLLPGCHIYPHTDDPEPDVLRFHLGLRCRGRAGLRIGATELEQTDDTSYVFDHSCRHEAGNLGDEPRDVLLVDFRLTAAEVEMVARLRRGEAAGA
ncbi:MAG: aspartyl/asparaginyl beta-hydroxylase domain-containing protein [Planctomycetota bacterium]